MFSDVFNQCNCNLKNKVRILYIIRLPSSLSLFLTTLLHLLSDIGHSGGKEGSRGQNPCVSRPYAQEREEGINCDSAYSSVPPFLLLPLSQALYGGKSSPRPHLATHC